MSTVALTATVDDAAGLVAAAVEEVGSW